MSGGILDFFIEYYWTVLDTIFIVVCCELCTKQYAFSSILFTMQDSY